MARIFLPDKNAARIEYHLVGTPIPVVERAASTSRITLAAAHVVADPMASAQPGDEPAIDWQRTLAFRRHLASMGLGIAEAMDTAQRGNGLNWSHALELIELTARELGSKAAVPIFHGAGTDHLDASTEHSLDEIIAAYEHQIEQIQKVGGRIIIMASRALAQTAKDAQCFAKVYERILASCDDKAILHWLGDMFDKQLTGYWGSTSLDEAADSCLAIIAANAAKIEGIKLSVLDADREISMRRRLPQDVRMYTGDDFNYPQLIAGDEYGFSDALLGILDPIAPAASAALAALDASDTDKFHALLDPTVDLAQLIFSAPTAHYKTGIVFLAWLNGHQDHFIMIAGAQSMRPLPYFTKLFELADRCGLLADSDLAVVRMKQFLTSYGFEQDKPVARAA